MDQVGERMLVTLTEVMEQAGAEPVLAVSHGGAMWAFYLKIAAQALDPKVHLATAPSAITIMSRDTLSWQKSLIR